MKRTLFIFALLFSSIFVNAQFHQAKQIDTDKGLRGSNIRLGMELKKFPFLVPVYTNFWIGGTRLDGYRNPDENLRFGNVKFDEIRYYFTNDTLTQINILFNADDNDKVVNEFSKVYGLASFVPLYPHVASFGWRGEEIILSMPREAPRLATFYYEEIAMKDSYDKGDKEMYEEMLKEPSKYCGDCSNKSEKQQKKIVEKRIKEFKQSRREGIKVYNQKLKDYKDSKYDNEHPKFFK